MAPRTHCACGRMSAPKGCMRLRSDDRASSRDRDVPQPKGRKRVRRPQWGRQRRVPQPKGRKRVRRPQWGRQRRVPRTRRQAAPKGRMRSRSDDASSRDRDVPQPKGRKRGVPRARRLSAPKGRIRSRSDDASSRDRDVPPPDGGQRVPRARRRVLQPDGRKRWIPHTRPPQANTCEGCMQHTAVVRTLEPSGSGAGRNAPARVHRRCTRLPDS